MSSVVIAGNTSGTVTLNAPDIAGTTVLTLPTTSGTLVTTAGGTTVPFALGSAASPSITFTGDTNTGIFSPGADTIGFAEGGAEVARFDSSGTFIVGPFGGGGNAVVAGSSSPSFTNQPGTNLLLKSGDGSGTGSSFMSFSTSPAGSSGTTVNTAVERMRIDSSGNLLVGTISNPNGYKLYVNGGNDRGMQLDAPSGGGVYTTLNFAQNGTLKTQLFWYAGTNEFFIQNSSGGVKLGVGSTSWASASDERLKDIIEPITNAAEKVSSLRAVIGKYKDDAEDKRRTFLIAQDVQAVLPEAVYSAKKARSEDDTEYLNLQYTDTIPLLVAAIKEQQAIITDLKARIEVLENK